MKATSGIKNHAYTIYVNTKSNHPEHVLKHILVAVNSRIQKISSGQSIFKEITQEYQEAIRASGYELAIYTRRSNLICQTLPTRTFYKIFNK